MFKRVAIAVLGLSLALPLIPSEAAEQHRGGDAALGALSGGIIFGPIGAVAGAVVGYTAGPSISHSLGVRSHQTHARRTKSVRQAQASTKYRQPAPDRQAALPAAAPAAAPAPPPPPLETATTMPPVQPLE